MTFRITTTTPDQVITGWTAARQARYRAFEDKARALAQQHGVPLAHVASAMLILSDVGALLGAWAEAEHFAPVFVTRHAPPPSDAGQAASGDTP
jgi:hypothetical protein